MPHDDEVPSHEVSLHEQYYTQPAISRRMPEQSREPRAALALLESEMLLSSPSWGPRSRASATTSPASTRC